MSSAGPHQVVNIPGLKKLKELRETIERGETAKIEISWIMPVQGEYQDLCPILVSKVCVSSESSYLWLILGTDTGVTGGPGGVAVMIDTKRGTGKIIFARENNSIEPDPQVSKYFRKLLLVCLKGSLISIEEGILAIHHEKMLKNFSESS